MLAAANVLTSRAPVEAARSETWARFPHGAGFPRDRPFLSLCSGAPPPPPPRCCPPLLALLLFVFALPGGLLAAPFLEPTFLFPSGGVSPPSCFAGLA